jgi:hypothetical protein
VERPTELGKTKMARQGGCSFVRRQSGGQAMNVVDLSLIRNEQQDAHVVDLRDPDDPIGQAIASVSSAADHILRVFAETKVNNPRLLNQFATENHYLELRKDVDKILWAASVLQTIDVANLELGRTSR